MDKSQVDLSLICQVCQISFDIEIRIPQRVKPCNHTVCLKCLQKLPPNLEKKCPLCFQRIDGNIEQNETIMDKIDDSKFEECLIHRKDITYFCEIDKRKLCSDCLYDKKSACANHQRYELETLKKDGKEGRDMYEARLESLENCYGRIQAKLVVNRETMEEMICNHFSEQAAQLENNKMRTLYDFNHAFNEEKTEFERDFGEESSVRDKLRAIISDYINILRIPNPIRALEIQYTDLNAKVDSLTMDNNNVLSFEKQLSSISGNLQKTLNKHTKESEKSWEDCMDNIIGQMKTKGLPEFQGTGNSLPLKKSELKVTSNLEFILKDRILSIVERRRTEHDKIKQEFSFSKENQKQVSEINFVFQDLEIENEDWEVISKLLHKILAHQDSSLELCFRSEKNDQSAAQISRLFTIFFQNPTKIVSLKISLYLNKDSMFLLNLVLFQLSNLESLSLTFRRRLFPMESFDSFIQGLRFLANNKLESLYLHLPKNHIKDSKLEKLQNLFIEMPVLKKFDLNVSEIPSLDKKIFATFARKYNQLMPQLQELLIDVTGTKVDAKYASHLELTFQEAIPKVEVRNRSLVNGNQERNGSFERS